MHMQYQQRFSETYPAKMYDALKGAAPTYIWKLRKAPN